MDMNQIGAVMDKFEASFDRLDVTSEYMSKAIDSTNPPCRRKKPPYIPHT